MLTYLEAIDEIFAMFREAWNLQSAGIAGYVPEIRWQGVEEPGKLNLTKFWARVSQQTTDEQQSTLRDGSCGQRYETEGFLFVQLFCPKSDSEAMEKGRKLAIVSRDVYRGKSTSGQVWFRNARVNELAPENEWFRFNIIVQYQYGEIN